MLDLELVINVVLGIAAYKAIIGIIKVTCIRLLVNHLGKKKYNRYKRMQRYQETCNPSGLQ